MGLAVKDLERHDMPFRLCHLEPLRGLTGKYHDLIFVLFSKKINLATMCKMDLEERAWGQREGTL